MELPRKVIIGSKILTNLCEFISESIPSNGKIALITGKNVKHKIISDIEENLRTNKFNFEWFIVEEASFKELKNITQSIKKEKISIIMGIGGGRCIDMGKMCAHNEKMAFVSIPTSASHDGLSSPFVSLRGSDKPYSIKVSAPIAIIGDLNVISNAPQRLIASGCGDLLAKITAIRDWALARDEKNEYFGEYAANLAYLGAKTILDISKKIINKEIDIQVTRTVVEGLISSGVAAGIAGSSRPCSGSEHLFSHALEYITNNKHSLHGERVGIGTIIMASLHKLDWKEIKDALHRIGAPTTAKEIKVDEDEVIDAIILAKKIRPERYTILNKTDLSRKDIRNLINEVEII